MSTPLPTQYHPTTSCTVTAFKNTVIDRTQDGTPFVRSLGDTRYTVSVSVEWLSDADATALITFLSQHRTEQIDVPLASQTYTGYLSSEPQRSWQSGDRSAVKFDMVT